MMIGASGHGKDIVDAINACDKRYLKGKWCMIGTLEAEDSTKRMDAHAMIGNKNLVGRLHAKSYWKTTLESKELNHIRNQTREKRNKRLIRECIIYKMRRMYKW